MHDIREGTCPLCAFTEILETDMRAFPPDSSAFGMWLTKDVDTANSLSPTHGGIFSYTCRRCGYTQLFVQNPADVPVSPAHHTKLIIGLSEQPFR